MAQTSHKTKHYNALQRTKKEKLYVDTTQEGRKEKKN